MIWYVVRYGVAWYAVWHGMRNRTISWYGRTVRFDILYEKISVFDTVCCYGMMVRCAIASLNVAGWYSVYKVRKEADMCILTFVEFPYFSQLFSSYEHFSAKHQVLGHMKPGRTHWSRSAQSVHSGARGGRSKFFFRREWIRRFPWFQHERPYFVRTYP